MKYLILFVFINICAYSQTPFNYDKWEQVQTGLNKLLEEFSNYKLALLSEAEKLLYKDMDWHEQVYLENIACGYSLAFYNINTMVAICLFEKSIKADMMENYKVIKQKQIDLTIDHLEFRKQDFESNIYFIKNYAIQQNVKEAIKLIDEAISELKKYN